MKTRGHVYPLAKFIIQPLTHSAFDQHPSPRSNRMGSDVTHEPRIIDEPAAVLTVDTLVPVQSINSGQVLYCMMNERGVVRVARVSADSESGT